MGEPKPVKPQETTAAKASTKFDELWKGEFQCKDMVKNALIIKQLHNKHYTVEECYAACAAEVGSECNPKCGAFNLRTGKDADITTCTLLKGECEKQATDCGAVVAHYKMEDGKGGID